MNSTPLCACPPTWCSPSARCGALPLLLYLCRCCLGVSCVPSCREVVRSQERSSAYVSAFQVPLCVLVGLLCGFASVLMADATIHASRTFRKLRGGVGRIALPAAALPPLGGLVTGLLAVICPQVMYRVCSLRCVLCAAPSTCVLLQHQGP